jgi:hypothetical protein
MPKKEALRKQAAGFIETMDCLPVPRLPEGPNWTYEILCCRPHKISYVAQRFMWRSLQGMRKGGRFGVHKRHITFGSETAKELHDARVRAPHLFLAPWFSSRMKIHPVSRPTHAGCDSETLVS